MSVNIAGLAIDWTEAVAGAADDPESRPAGFAEPHYQVSHEVTVSRDRSIYVYHVPDDQLGQGSSFGNARAWAETKGNGDMLGLYSIDAGTRVLGGMSIAYLLPFSDLSPYGMPISEYTETKHDAFARAMPSAAGEIHLHSAYQQREFVIGDGLHVLETFFLPRTGLDDPAAAHAVVFLKNRTPHPIGITVIASLDLRGHTPRDVAARFDESRAALVAWNQSRKDWVRVFGGSDYPEAYCATTDEEEAYSPGQRLSNRTDEVGDLTGALQFDMLLLPGRHHKIRLTAAFASEGTDDAMTAYDRASQNDRALSDTIAYYCRVLGTAVVEMPDNLLTHGVQWAKACLVRPVSVYAVGVAATNDPGRSNHLVGRDTAWYIYGADFVNSEWSCSLLNVFARRQRQDGLIPEYIDGNTGRSEDYGFNINDDTPLFIMAAGHHIKSTGHEECLETLYEPARRAGELILRQRDEKGLVKCTQDGVGPRAICSWRNVLENEQITGVVTEVNSECYAALSVLSDLAKLKGRNADARRYREEADRLRDHINKHLINPENGLYVRNIDLNGHVYTQATADLVFPLICGVPDDETTRVISARLSEADFMTDAGIRVLPSENPRYDPAFQSGCMGGVWPGVTWWYAMSCQHLSPKIMAEALRRAYWHYVSDPKVYNTVPGQFSEWSDGQTLVNRGMRLSPWEPPRFLWAAIEGLAGIKLGTDEISLDPQLPPDWSWMRLANLPCRGQRLSYFLTREGDGLHVYTSSDFGGELVQHRYDKELPEGTDTITTGISTAVFCTREEVIICLGSRLESPVLGPFLTHHSLDAGRNYCVARLTSQDARWTEVGLMSGTELQRITVRLEPGGYALYRFAPAR